MTVGVSTVPGVRAEEGTDAPHILARFQVPAAPEAVAGVRQQATTFACVVGARSELTEKVRLLVSELVTNVLQHTQATMVTVELSVCRGGADLRMQVAGEGASVSSPLRLVATHPPPEQEAGRGLVLVDNLAQTWGHEGASTWCTLPLAPVGEQVPRRAGELESAEDGRCV